MCGLVTELFVINILWVFLKEKKAEKVRGNKARLKTLTTQNTIVMDRKKAFMNQYILYIVCIYD